MAGNTVTIWCEAVHDLQNSNFEKALEKFSRIVNPSSRILYNIGFVHLIIGDSLELAIMNLNESISKDQHLAIAYYQRAIAYFKLGSFQDAMGNFESCYEKFRGKNVIDYSHMGMDYKLFASLPLQGKAMCLARENKMASAIDTLQLAKECEADKLRLQSYDAFTLSAKPVFWNVLELPSSAVFLPPKFAMVDSLPQKTNYLGKAKVIAACDEEHLYVGFGALRKKDHGSDPALSISANKPWPATFANGRVRIEEDSSKNLSQPSQLLSIESKLTSTREILKTSNGSSENSLDQMQIDKESFINHVSLSDKIVSSSLTNLNIAAQNKNLSQKIKFTRPTPVFDGTGSKVELASTRTMVERPTRPASPLPPMDLTSSAPSNQASNTSPLFRSKPKSEHSTVVVSNKVNVLVKAVPKGGASERFIPPAPTKPLPPVPTRQIPLQGKLSGR